MGYLPIVGAACIACPVKFACAVCTGMASRDLKASTPDNEEGERRAAKNAALIATMLKRADKNACPPDDCPMGYRTAGEERGKA